MPEKAIRKRIDTANEQIATAQAALDVALQELHVMPRHAKTIISKVVEDAVARLAATKQDLLKLTVLLADIEAESRAGTRKK
jgi:hypothetical protein